MSDDEDMDGADKKRFDEGSPMATLLDDIGFEKRSPQKRSRAAATLSDLFEQVTDRAITKSDRSWDQRLPAILKAQDEEMDIKIKASEARTESTIKKLEGEIKDMKEAINKFSSASSAASMAPSHATGAGMSSATTTTRWTRREPFTPSRIEVKGFIPDWSKRDDDSLTKPEVTEWIANACGQLPIGVANFLDLEATEKFSNRVLYTRTELRLKKDIDRQSAWEVKRGLDDLWMQGECYIKDIKPYAVVEASPEKKPYFQQGGRFLGIMEKKGIMKSSLKPEWGPLLMIYNISGNRPVTIAQYDTDKGWALYEGPLKDLLPDTTVEEIMSLLK